MRSSPRLTPAGADSGRPPLPAMSGVEAPLTPPSWSSPCRSAHEYLFTHLKPGSGKMGLRLLTAASSSFRMMLGKIANEKDG